MTVKHAFRHLDYGRGATIDEIGAAGLEALLEEGDLAGWRPVLEALRRDPWGPTARRVERLLPHLQTHGTATLFRRWIDRCRGGLSSQPVVLADLRVTAGLTQAVLAERMGVSQAQVARIENAENPTLRSVQRYLASLGRHVEGLLVAGGDTLELVRLASTSTGPPSQPRR